MATLHALLASLPADAIAPTAVAEAK